MCKGIREGLPFLATEENTNRGLTDAWLSQDGKFTATTGPGVIMSAVRSCNNVDIDCAGNLRCIEDYTRNNCFSLRRYFTRFSLLDYFYHIPFGALLRRFESTALLSLSLSLAILNPFSSPEDDEDWIGRNVALFRWNCWGEGGTKESRMEETLLLSRLPFCFAIWKNFLLWSSYQIYEHSSRAIN